MKLAHHIPRQAISLTEPVTPAYQAAVDRATAKLERAYEQAQKRLERAELRLQRARTKSVSRAAAGTDQRELKVAAELVELRREELQRLEAMMKAHPASTDHRGRGGHRPVPQPGPLI